MSSETVERPEPRADGSYPEPKWEGRWLVRYEHEGRQCERHFDLARHEYRGWQSKGNPTVGPLLEDGDRWYPVTVHGLDGAAPSKEPEPTPAEPSLKGNYSAFVNVYFDEYRRRFPSMDYRVLSGSQIQALASDKVFAALAAFRGDAPPDESESLRNWRAYAGYLRSCLESGEQAPHDFDAFVARSILPPEESPKSPQAADDEWETRIAIVLDANKAPEDHPTMPSGMGDLWARRVAALAAQRDAAQAEVDRLTKERDEAVKERDEARRQFAGLERRELEKSDATSLPAIDALLASRGFPSEDSVYLRVKKVLDLERDGRLQWDKARMELAEVECEKKELATLLEAREVEAARQSAPRPLPESPAPFETWEAWRDHCERQVHWSTSTQDYSKALIALLDWAESAQPAPASIESRLSSLEAAVAKMGEER